MSKKQQLILTLLVFCLTIAFAFYYLKQLKTGIENAAQTTTPSQKLSVLKQGPVELLFEELFDFEKNEAGELSDKVASTGKFSHHFSDKLEYGFSISKKLIETQPKGIVSQVNYTFKLYASTPPKDAVVVCSIDDAKGKTDIWLSSPIDFKKIPFKANEWNDVNASFDIDFSNYDDQHIFKIYIWNKSKEEFFIDDVSVEYSGYSAHPKIKYDEADLLNKKLQQNFELDFESDSGLENANTISSENPRSGKHSVKLNGSNEYGAGIRKQVSEISSDTLRDVFIRAWIFSKEEKANVVLVASVISSDGKTKSWQGKGTETYTFKKNEWNLVNAWLSVSDANANPTDFVTAYVWDKGKDNVYVDDMLIVCGRYDEHSGLKSTIDMRPTTEQGFTPIRNKPPYDISYLEKQKINFNEGKFLNSHSKSELFPDATFLVGDFLSTDYTLKSDELVQIQKNVLQLYSYCEKENAFILKHNSVNENFNTQNNFVLRGSFFGKGKSEHEQLITLNKSNSEFHLYEFTVQENCNHTQSQLNEVGSGNLFVKLNSKVKALSFDTDNDGQDELILIDPDENKLYIFFWNGKHFEQKSVTDLKSLNISLNEKDRNISVASFKYMNKNAMVIVSSTNKNLLVYDDARKTFVNAIDKSKLEIASMGDEYFPFNKQLLKINSTFRNDLKLIAIDADGLTIEKNIDFTGYEKDFNPKYYEMCKIIPGKFLNSNSTSLVVIQKNCTDKNFDGINCKQYEELKDLPNKVELYK